MHNIIRSFLGGGIPMTLHANLSPSLGHHVAVAHRGHGDECPPQAEGNGRKVVIGIGLK